MNIRDVLNKALIRLRQSTSLRLALQDLNPDAPVTLVFADSSYTQVFDNWWLHARECGLENLLAVALDQGMAEHLSRESHRCYSLVWDGKLESLWLQRLVLIRDLLDRGFDILHSDADAVWLRDPLPELLKEESDMSFSQGVAWPRDAHGVWGLVLCCGFFLLRSSPRTCQFLDRWAESVSHLGDDQVAVNRLLLNAGVHWRSPGDYELEHAGHRINCFDSSQVASTRNGLRVALLPHTKFQRIPMEQPAVLVHPVAKSTGDSKAKVLRDHGLWKL